MTILNNVRLAGTFFLDLIFPKFCVGCGQEGDWLCPKCFRKIVFIKQPTCPRCQKLTPQGQFCSSCQSRSHLAGIICACHWQEGSLKELIHVYKYEYINGLAEILGNFLIQRLQKVKLPPQTLVIPIPLHRKRLWQRGFNQAELLARQVARHFGWELGKRQLYRARPTQPQMELKGKERRANLRGAFSFRGPINLKNRPVLLVDDVATTGTTLEEAAKALRAAGARQVWGLVVARG